MARNTPYYDDEPKGGGGAAPASSGGGGGGGGSGARPTPTPTPASNAKEQPKEKPKKEQPNYFDLTDAQIRALTPAQKRSYGRDAFIWDRLKEGGRVSASSRADGIALRGKTRG